MAADDALEAMADRSKAQLHDFLKFFETKREVFDTELTGLFGDVEDARLGDAMYSIDDVRSILEDAKAGVAEAATRELEKHANMAGLVLEQVFAGALAGGVDLAIDLSRTEDAAALARVGKLKLLDKHALDATRRAAAAKEDSLKSEQMRLSMRVRELEGQLEGRMQEAAKAAAQADALRAERGDLVRRLEAAERAASAATSGTSADGAAAADAAAAEREALRVRVAELQTELDDARAELASAREASASAGAAPPSPAAGASAAAAAPRVTKQFQRMREMLKAKTQQVKDLRARLSKYEPDDVRVVEEADETPLVPRMA